MGEKYMRLAHFDCFSGISGDMTLGALTDAGVPVGVIREGLDSLQLPITLEVEEVLRGCFAAKYVTIRGPNEQPQRFLRDIQAIIEKGKLTTQARNWALAIFQRLGEAEAAAHGMSIEEVHFHEVGALDSIADIIGSAIGLDYLGVDEFTSSPVPTGSGTVKAAHGIMPVPTPATATLLKGVPLASSTVKAELTTPTGAAILTTVVKHWCESPVMTIEHIGYGAGTRDFPERPNVLRLFVGTTAADSASAGVLHDEVWLLETSIDNISGEILGYTMEMALAAGALDVFTTPIQMKKQRPGILLTVLVEAPLLQKLENLIFAETGTLGIRRIRCERSKLHRKAVEVATPWGHILGKLAWREGEKPQFTPEYDSCRVVAERENIPLRDVYKVVYNLHSAMTENR
ncbi:MAG TPA: nickel pincer cofactor biosynthesis protein LarC [Gemmatales bacterium]|nr:nickel pincer cofactor biosynthesis protein LarC [Gemmatales bacterium]